MKSKKKSLRCVKGAIAFLNSLKGAIKKRVGNPDLDIRILPDSRIIG